jgi:hypothetical protein
MERAILSYKARPGIAIANETNSILVYHHMGTPLVEEMLGKSIESAFYLRLLSDPSPKRKKAFRI